jgi:hypothetical protein
MDNKQLLELAARAAGIQGAVEEVQGTVVIYLPDCRMWNPLNDNRDALDLAIKLKITVIPGTTRAATHYGLNPQNDGQSNGWGCYVDHNGDPAAAVRLAIVRAAAGTAKVMAEHANGMADTPVGK